MRRTKADTTVWGATRAYRADCLPTSMALEPCMGWDGLDEIRVQLRGMRTQTFVDLPFRHHRPEGGRELSSLHQGEALGPRRPGTWATGRPTSPCGRSTARAGSRPRSAMLWGYVGGRGAGARRAARTRRLVRRAARAPAAGRHAPPRRAELLSARAATSRTAPSALRRGRCATTHAVAAAPRGGGRGCGTRLVRSLTVRGGDSVARASAATRSAGAGRRTVTAPGARAAGAAWRGAGSRVAGGGRSAGSEPRAHRQRRTARPPGPRPGPAPRPPAPYS